ncbi:MAG: hypothetical protein ACFFG0_03195 [Candidatus Thorarchaeota archaeon]
MSRKDILTNMRAILSLLSNKEEYSIKRISYEINAHWQTTLKALEFLKETNIVKERLGEEDNRKTRLFSLNN